MNEFVRISETFVVVILVVVLRKWNKFLRSTG